MSRIIINEDDQTALAESSLGEVVFVAGFSNNNANAYVVSKDTDPTTSDLETIAGTVYQDGDTVNKHQGEGTAPSLYINTKTKHSWKCTAVVPPESEGGTTTYTWTATDAYVEPITIGKGEYPELCTSAYDFKQKFGDAPFEFEADQDLSEFDGTNTLESASAFRKNGEKDLSYIYALELLNNGLQVVYSDQTAIASVSASGGDSEGRPKLQQIQALYQNVATALDAIKDKGTYNVKYITLGAYPSYEMTNGSTTSSVNIASAMIGAAKNRGDAVALIDHGQNASRNLTGDGSVIKALRTETTSLTDGDFGTMFTPHGIYEINDLGAGVDGSYILPASFAYLVCLARAIKTNPSWLAMSGVARGVVPYLKTMYTDHTLTNTIANDDLQKDDDVSINPITYIRGYGYTIWGNRTLKGTPLSAMSYLSIRNMTSDIKKVVYDSANARMFEPNTDTLWINFKSDVMPTLDRMKTGRGIKGYKFAQQTTDDRTKLKALIKIQPVYATEKFDITLSITDDKVDVE